MLLKVAAMAMTRLANTLHTRLAGWERREVALIQRLYPYGAHSELKETLKAGLAAFPTDGVIDPTAKNTHAMLHQILAQQATIESERVAKGEGYKNGFKTYATDARAMWFYYVANTILTHDDMKDMVTLYETCPMRRENVLYPKQLFLDQSFADESDPDVAKEEEERATYEAFLSIVSTDPTPLSPFRDQIKALLRNGQVVHALQTAMNALKFVHLKDGSWCLQPRSVEGVFGDAEEAASFMAKLPPEISALYKQAGTIDLLYSPSFWRSQHREDIAERLEDLGLTDTLDYSKIFALLCEHDDGKFLTPVDGLPQYVTVGDSRPTELPAKRVAMDVPLFDADLVAHETAPNTLGAGLSSLTMTGFHDWYKALFYERNPSLDMPKGFSYLVRFHSCYMQHHHLKLAEYADATDWLMLPLLRLFQQCDLYSKEKPTAEDLQGIFAFSSQVEEGYRALLDLPDSQDVLLKEVGFPVVS